MHMRRTMWEISDQHRLRRAWMLAYFAVLWTVCLSIPLFSMALAGRLLVFLLRGDVVGVDLLMPSAGRAELLYAFAVCVAALLGIAYVGAAIFRGESSYLSLLGAHRASSEQLPETCSALRDMSIAAGLSSPPALYLIPDDASVNAIVLGRPPATVAVAVTRGLATRADERLQRAVFASLLSRFHGGGVSWTSLLFMLVRPIRAITDRVRPRALRVLAGIQLAIGFLMILSLLTYEYSTLGPGSGISIAVLGWSWLSVSLAAALASLWAVAFVLEVSHRSAYSALAQSADAEGVVLLRNPDDLLGALRAVMGEDTRLVGGRGFSYLSFVDCERHPLDNWILSTESHRLSQLEELVFPSGGRGVQPMRIAPPSVRPGADDSVRHDPESEMRRAHMRKVREEDEAARQRLEQRHRRG